MSDVATSLLNAQRRMEEVRSGFEDSMQHAFNYVNPRRYDMTGTAAKGAVRKTKMYDGVAQDAFLDWVDGMLGWAVSESLTWQRAAMANRKFRDDDGVQRYLDEYTEQMSWEFRMSNFYDCEPEWLQDAGSGGTGVILTEESTDLKRIVHRVPHPANYWIAENADREVDVYHEKVVMTARQAYEKYNKPGDTLNPIVKKWAQDANSALWEVTFLQCVRPSDDPVFERRLKYSNYVVVTILYELSPGAGAVNLDAVFQDSGNRLVRIEPLDYFSPTVWRFRRNSDELYGYSPAMDVMTVIQTAQKHSYNLLEMGNLAAKPPTWGPEEKRTEWSFLAGARNWYGSEKRLPVIPPMSPEYPIAADREEKLHALIRKRYGWHVWNAVLGLQAKRERVQATEVLEVRSDQARLLTGQFNNFWRNGMKPTYGNVSVLASRAGRMPEAPAVLQDLAGKDEIDIEFLGPLSQIQVYATKIGGLQQGMKFLADVAEIIGRHVSPQEAAELYDRVNLPDLAEYVCDESGFPQKLMRTDEQTAARTEGRNRRLQAQEQAANVQKLAAATAQAGKANEMMMAGAA